MPGVGKSSVGRQVAGQLGWRFADCDQEIERHAGCTIATLFVRDGESAFRELEANTLAALIETGPAVVATGGGTVLRVANRELLHSRTRCVYLSASPEFLWRRLRRDRRRPLLQVTDPRTRLREMSEEREPLYRETASIVIDIEGLALAQLVGAVLDRLGTDVQVP
ncbi:MAG: shikimate kinase [Pseudomonadota bacterium]|nr:shikimate kinase [Pseudomonadota bacterium]